MGSRDYNETYVTGTGQLMRYVHKEGECEGRYCPIHNPSPHAESIGHTHWRSDRKIMERICEHGVGHPDPDDINIVNGGYKASVHGCDGCCNVLKMPMDEKGMYGIPPAMPCERCGNDPCICYIINKPRDMVKIKYNPITYKEAWKRLHSSVRGLRDLGGEDVVEIENLLYLMQKIEEECA